jgi:protease I
MAKKAVFLVPQIGFNEVELFTLKKTLEKNKIECAIASYAKGTVIGKNAKKANATEIICNINHKDYDCFIIVGGENVSSLSEHSCVINLLETADKGSRIIALLCMAPALFLSVSDILKHKKLTVFPSKNGWSMENIIKHGGILVDEPVVVDGNIVSCRNEEDSQELADILVKMMK